MLLVGCPNHIISRAICLGMEVLVWSKYLKGTGKKRRGEQQQQQQPINQPQENKQTKNDTIPMLDRYVSECMPYVFQLVFLFPSSIGHIYVFNCFSY